MERTRRTRRRRRGVERVKNVLIVLLTLSAVYLAARTLAYDELMASTPQGWLATLLSVFQAGENPQLPAETGLTGSQTAAAARPVRIAVHNGTERYAVEYDAARTDRVFDAVGILLSEALASAGQPQAVEEAAWRGALQSPGVWFDFLGDIPLEALYAWMGEGGSNPALSGATARQLAVALTQEGNVALYYHNETDGLYYACQTGVAYFQHMDELLQGYGSSGAAFAFELEEDGDYAGLDPYVLIFASASASPLVYRAANPMADPDNSRIAALQQAVGFQPQGNSVYPAVQGGLMIREGRETLLIGDDGTVQYRAAEGETSRYPVGEGDGDSVVDLVEATRALAVDSVGRFCGAARLYLMGLTQNEDGTVEARYGYTLNGAAVLLPDGRCAASFTVQEGYITAYTLYFRSYEETGEHSLLLPERQAAAALNALNPEGRELTLCYTDGGGDTVEAGWAAR